MLPEESNNYLASVYGDETGVCLAFADVSTGELNVVKPYISSDYGYHVVSELTKYSPKEIIINGMFNSNEKLMNELKARFSFYINVFRFLVPIDLILDKLFFILILSTIILKIKSVILTR